MSSTWRGGALVRTTVAAALGLIMAACSGGGDGNVFPESAPDTTGRSGEELAEDILRDAADLELGNEDESQGRALDVELERLTGFQPFGLAAGDGEIWMTDNENDVVRVVDLDTGDVSPDIPVGDAPVGIAVDGDEVWITNSGAGDHTVMRIDANSGEVDLTVELEAGSSLSGIALTDDHVWVSRGGRTDISQLDRTTGEELQIISEEPGFGGSGIVQLLVTDDGLWAVDRWCGRVVQIDTDTGDIAAVYDDLGYESTEPETCTGGVGAEGPLRIAEFEGGIFVLQQVVTDEGLQTGRISRIDPDTEEVQTLTDVPFNPGTVIPMAVPALVVEDGGIWLTSGDQAVRMTREGGRFDGVFSGSTTSIVALIEVDGKVWYAVSDRNGELSGLYGIDTDEATEAAA